MGNSVGPVGLTAQIIREEGILGLYRGFVSTCARETFGYFFFFGGYELSKYLLTPHGKTAEDLGHVKVALSGGIAGSCFWTSVFPLDVVKSRVQVFGVLGTVSSWPCLLDCWSDCGCDVKWLTNKTETTPTGKPDNFLKIILTIIRKEGFRTLYKGLGPAVLRSFPANGALFLAYEGTERLLK